MKYMMHREACEKNPVGALVFGNGQLGQVTHIANEFVSGNVLQQIVKLTECDLCHVFEHSDLLKLKAAVEKALEVTPKPPKYIVDGHDIVLQAGQMAVLVGYFTNPQLAEEYVAWKNAQEGK